MRSTDIERVCARACTNGTRRSELQSSLQYTEVSQPDLKYQGIERVTCKETFFDHFYYDLH